MAQRRQDEVEMLRSGADAAEQAETTLSSATADKQKLLEQVLALQYDLLIETAAVEAEQQESHCLAGGRPAPEGGLCHGVAASSAKAAVAQQQQECEQLRTGGLEALQQREAQLTTMREARDGLMAKVEDSRAQLDSIK